MGLLKSYDRLVFNVQSSICGACEYYCDAEGLHELYTIENHMGTKGAGNRQRIIEAADQLFHTRGYNQTSFSDISDVTGIPRGNFYYYFKTKDDILNAVVEDRLGAYREMLADCERQSDDPRQRLLSFVGFLDSHAEGILQSGCPIGSLTSELAKDEPELQLKSREVFDLLRDWLAKQLGMLGLENTGERALDILARMQGVSIIACAYKDRDYLQRNIAELKSWINAFTSN
jgi:AcrR family transcriptional regulator